MGYHLTFNITNHSNSYGGSVDYHSHSTDKGKCDIYGQSIADNGTATQAFIGKASGNDEAKATVVYLLPDSSSTMTITYGTYNDGDQKTFNVYVEIQGPNGTGCDSFFVINGDPVGGSDQTDDFTINLFVHQAGDTTYEDIPDSINAGGTRVKIGNNTEDNTWITLQSSDHIPLENPHAVTGGTTSVCPGGVMYVYNYYSGQTGKDVYLYFNVTKNYIMRVQPQDAKAPGVYWPNGQGPFTYSFSSTEDNQETYIIYVNES